MPSTPPQKLSLHGAEISASAPLHLLADGKNLIVLCDISDRAAAEIHADILPKGSLTLITIQNSLSPKSTILQRGKIGEGGALTWFNLTLGADPVAWDLRSDVRGDNGISEVNWLFLAQGKERYNLTMRNVFHGKNGRGEITVKGVVEDHAHVTAKGMIEIGKEGGGTETYLREAVLMLDATARVDAVPALEIKTNDVRASHSASVTKLNDEDLFYMGSRGISRDEARRMVIEGFLGSLLGKIEDEGIRKKMRKAIEKKMAM